ncbi:MAG: hypothetical protein QN187_08790 [Armatimonadota bacterium]|nr:hypothetical protein [Armatimonadota bacterium]MDR7518916.1 hypothetical protein [Armatimonadota bacterium]
MGRTLTLAILVMALVTTTAGSSDGAQRMIPPKVTLNRVEVAAFFPYAPPPARVPLILAFVFDIENPNDFTVRFDELGFTYGFEAVPFRFIDLNTPRVYETMHIPPRTTNQLRVVSVLDSLIVPSTLAVAEGRRVAELGIRIPDLVRSWWETIGDFQYRIRVSNGTVRFAGEGGTVLVTFRGTFPPYPRR